MSQSSNVAPTLGPIEHIAHYSCDGDGTIRYDLSNLATFTPPRIGAKLLEGCDAFVSKNRNNRFLGHPITLNNLLGPCIAFGAAERILAAHVVTWRGIMTKLMLGTPIEVQFSYLENVLFVEEFDPSPRKNHSSQLREGYHGYAFEALCTAPASPGEIPMASLDLWKCVISRSLGDLNLVLGGEVDCVRGEYDNTSCNFVELKTSRQGRPIRNRDKWFFQSHLLGVPEIVLGTRANDGTLVGTAALVVEDMYPSAAEGQEGMRERGYRTAYKVLKQLRAFCAAHEPAGETRSLVWRAKVSRGVAEPPVVLKDTRGSSKIVGLVASEYVAQLTALA